MLAKLKTMVFIERKKQKNNVINFIVSNTEILNTPLLCAVRYIILETLGRPLILRRREVWKIKL